MTVDDVRGVMNQLLYPIDGAPDLGDATAARLARQLIDGRLFSATAADAAAAIDRTLRTGGLHPQTVSLSRRYSEPELLGFLHRLAAHLATREP